jgi:NAD+ kinase
MSERRRVALFVKRTAWAEYADHRDGLLAKLVARGDPSVEHVRASHEDHVGTVAEVERALRACGADVEHIARRADFDEARFALVVTVGGDGTLLRASHNVGRAPVLGVNSAPAYSVGFFCGARKGEVMGAIAAALEGRLAGTVLTRMQVSLGDRVLDARVLNDVLFCHSSPAATSRYLLELGGVVEEQKSSGFWIGPAAGSTAAQRSAGGAVLPLDSDALQLVVREPYVPDGRPYQLQRILIPADACLRVRSKSRRMRLYIDGPEHVERVTIGDVFELRRSPEPLRLLGITSDRARAAGGAA